MIEKDAWVFIFSSTQTHMCMNSYTQHTQYTHAKVTWHCWAFLQVLTNTKQNTRLSTLLRLASFSGPHSLVYNLESVVVPAN